MRAEDLNVANLVIKPDAYVYDEKYSEGVRHPLSATFRGQEMRNRNLYGRLIFNLKNWYGRFTPSQGLKLEDYRLTTGRQSARVRGGAVSYAHPALVFDHPPSGSDAIESVCGRWRSAHGRLRSLLQPRRASMAAVYRFLNLGFHLGIAASSDAFLNQDFAFVAGGSVIMANTGKTSHAQGRRTPVRKRSPR
jgi:hypothetical protein